VICSQASENEEARLVFEAVCTTQMLEVPSTFRVSQSATRKVSKGQFFALAAWQCEGKLAIMEATCRITIDKLGSTDLQIVTGYYYYNHSLSFVLFQTGLVRFMPLTPRNAMRNLRSSQLEIMIVVHP